VLNGSGLFFLVTVALIGLIWFVLSHYENELLTDKKARSINSISKTQHYDMHLFDVFENVYEIGIDIQ